MVVGYGEARVAQPAHCPVPGPDDPVLELGDFSGPNRAERVLDLRAIIRMDVIHPVRKSHRTLRTRDAPDPLVGGAPVDDGSRGRIADPYQVAAVSREAAEL